MGANLASLRKGGCQPKADWRVVSTLLIFMVVPCSGMGGLLYKLFRRPADAAAFP